MDELIKLLDDHTTYIGHELIEDAFTICVSSNRQIAACPLFKS
ncbi:MULTISPECIES: hypothetical protein [unclassified Enterococcus]|nr:MULTISPECIES: hypothetical protein [unclassified Enterococcus]